MELTDAGKQFLERVSGLVRQLEVSIHDVQSLRGEVKGHVALGLMPTISTVLSVRLIQQVAKQLPGVTLRLVEGYSVHLLEWLQRGDIDVSFLYGPATDYHLHGEDLLLEEIALISKPGALAQQETSISLEQAAELPLALPGELFGLRRVLDRVAKQRGVKLQPRYELDSFWVIRSLVETGIGFSLMPVSSVQQEVASGKIATQRLDPPIQRKVMLAMPQDRSNTRATDAVLELLKTEVRAMVACGEWPAELVDQISA